MKRAIAIAAVVVMGAGCTASHPTWRVTAAPGANDCITKCRPVKDRLERLHCYHRRCPGTQFALVDSCKEKHAPRTICERKTVVDGPTTAVVVVIAIFVAGVASLYALALAYGNAN